MGLIFTDPGKKRFEIQSHRCRSAEETLAKYMPLAREFGISRIANVTGLDRIGIPVTLAIRPNSRTVAVSQGKGSTLAHAKASAMMEAIEIWHAEFFTHPVLYGRECDLNKSAKFVDTNRLPGVVGSNYDDHVHCLWVEGEDFFTGETKLVPFEMIHANYTHEDQPAHGYFPSSTNGLASGNSKIEAACHSISEVIERDALSLWHFQSAEYKAERRVDLQTVNSEECTALIRKILDAGIEVGLWNVTSDIEVPTFVCAIREPQGDIGHIGLGEGTHPDKTVAARRAITEAVQTRLNYISGARDDLLLSEFDADGKAAKQELLEEYFISGECPVNFQELPSQTNATLQEDLDFLLESLAKAGIEECVWVDLMRDEYGVPVCRTVIPGLEAPHDDGSYLPGARAEAVMNQ